MQEDNYFKEEFERENNQIPEELLSEEPEKEFLYNWKGDIVDERK